MVLVGFSISNLKFGLKAELSRSKVTLTVYCESRDGCDCTTGKVCYKTYLVKRVRVSNNDSLEWTFLQICLSMS